MCVCVCTCLWKPEVNARYLPQLFSLFLRHNISLKLEFLDSARLTGYKAPGILLALLPWPWNDRNYSFLMGPGNETLALTSLTERLPESLFLNGPCGFIIGGSFKEAGYHNRKDEVQMWAVWRGIAHNEIYIRYAAAAGIVSKTALSQPGMEEQSRLRLCGKKSFNIL